MGLFSKEKCSVCGKESRLLSKYNSSMGTKHLCDNCKQNMHAVGFIWAEDYYNKRPTFEQIENYQKFYSDCGNILIHTKNTIVVNFSDIVFNKDVVCFPQYPDLMIPSDDVFLVVYTDLPKYSTTFTDAFLLTFFTTNRTIPYYSIIMAGKANFFSLTGKAKDYREATFSIIESIFTNLICPVDKAKVAKKLVKKDISYNLSVDKKQLISWLDDAEYLSGQFNPKSAERDVSKDNWAIEFFKQYDIECK